MTKLNTPDKGPHYKNKDHIDDRIPERIFEVQKLRVSTSQNVFHPNILLNEKSRPIKDPLEGGEPRLLDPLRLR
jgi:hypothetical protein